MASRLVIIALVPLILLTAVSAPLALGALRNADRAQAADRQIPTLTKAVVALSAVVAEHGNAETVLLTLKSGFSLAAASKVLGVDLHAALGSAESATDAAVPSLPPPLAATVAARLSSVRSSLGRGPTAVSVLDNGYEQVEKSIEAVAASTLESAEARAASTSGSQSVSRSLIALGWCYYLVEAAAAQARDDAAVWFSAAGSSPSAAIRLAHDNALFDEAGRRIATSGVPDVTRAWRAYAGNPFVAQYDALLVSGEQSRSMPFANGKVDPTSASISVATLAGAIRGISVHWQLISALVAAASTTLHRDAAALASTSTGTWTTWLVMILVAVVVALAVAVVAARSISVPLGRLARAARSVVTGHLDVEQLPPRGPTETVVVAEAFNSLMANLRLLESKTQALATCDFENPVLSVPLPGRLGASLQDSVHVLAGSIHDRHELQQRLAHEATHDPLTGLLNRAAAITALEDALARAHRTSDTTAVMYIDLDNFKQANDLHGHQTGDLILRQVAARFSSSMRSGDVLARLGGDEFVAITERAADTDAVLVAAKRLAAALAEPLEIGTEHLSLGASFGIAMATGDETTALELLARADMALYQAKERKGGAISVFDAALQERLAEQDRLERDLRAELDAGGQGLQLHYQPLVDRRQVLRGVEALLRWNRPGDGPVPPDRLIPIAEASDLIIDLDLWVMTTAARQMVAWSRQPQLRGLNVSVNVSGRHLISQTLPQHLQQVLDSTGADPTRLTIEITETVLLDELTIAADELAKVRRLGVKVAIDDFGTGYTSLAHIQQLPVDTIKIDRSFISALEDSEDVSLVRMITELAHDLGLVTVSEGVETPGQLETLRELGSDYIQGYHVARPMPASDLSRWATAHTS